jgi:hypothetical protein
VIGECVKASVLHYSAGCNSDADCPTMSVGRSMVSGIRESRATRCTVWPRISSSSVQV